MLNVEDAEVHGIGSLPGTALDLSAKGWAPQLVQRFLGYDRSWQVRKYMRMKLFILLAAEEFSSRYWPLLYTSTNRLGMSGG